MTFDSNTNNKNINSYISYLIQFLHTELVRNELVWNTLKMLNSDLQTSAAIYLHLQEIRAIFVNLLMSAVGSTSKM
jgi:hypothetical protein